MSMRTFAAVIVVALASVCTAAAAAEFKAGTITVEQPWVRPSIGSATNSAAYMKLENSGDAPDRLLAVKSDAAEHVMLHESRMEMGVMKMRHVEGGIEIPAHGSAELKPLGLHVMLMGLKAPLKDGETLPLTLVFEKQGEVSIDAKVGQPQK
jgi:periplasmic copper chaperone A